MDKKRLITILAIVAVVTIIVVVICLYLDALLKKSYPDKVFTAYMTYLQNGEYEQMYELLDQKTKSDVSKDVFVSRNKNIYNGIEAKNITISNMNVQEFENRNSKNHI